MCIIRQQVRGGQRYNGNSFNAHNRTNYHPGLPNCINYVRIFNNLLRTMMLIVFGLANLNNGLTSYVVEANINDELHRNINQKLIMSPTAILNGALLPSTAALTAESPSSLSSSASSSSSSSLSLSTVLSASQLPYPPGSISASSSLTSATSSSASSSSATAGAASSSSSASSALGTGGGLSTMYQRPSGSSITSFDSTNVIDEKQRQHSHQHQHQYQHQHHQQQQQQQQQFSHSFYKNPQLGKETEARPLHRIVGVGGSGSSTNVGLENQLDMSTNVDGDEDAYGGNIVAPMYFGTENSTVVTTQIGATAHIPCTVHHIGDGVVSWIRRKDYHLLTVGLTTYSSDERFSATHLKHSEDWTLQIKFVQLRDAGVYECQVSTHPPTSIFLHLNVVEARAEISGRPIRYLTPGSTLRLQCRVVQNTEASEFIFWYHDNRMINYDIDRGINVSTEPDFQSSELTILKTRREHSGNYTCVASNTQPASVLVHIFKGDNPAAMYHGHVGSSTKSYQTHLHSLMVILALSYRILHTHVHLKIV